MSFEVTKNIKESRIELIDVIKGGGIILVVWAHANGPCSNYIIQFHMPLFFLISGYLFNQKNSLKVFIVKKFLSLYLPFVIVNVLGGIFRWTVGIKDYSILSFGKYVLDILLTIGKDGQFFGATWFLGDLFIISVIYKLFDVFIEDGRFKRTYITILFVILGGTGLTITFWNDISRTMVCSMFYALGVFLKQFKKEFSRINRPIVAIFCTILFWAIASHNYVYMGGNDYGYRGLFVIEALCGSYSFFAIICMIYRCSWMKRMLTLLGRYSLDIVIWQFIAFRFVIVLQLAINNLSLYDTLKYYPTYDTGDCWWILYIVAGLFGSLIIGKGLRRINRKTLFPHLYS